MARVIISAGHTLNEPGAVSGDLREVDLTRKIADKVTNKLRREGIITLQVPPELELQERIDWINKTGYSESSEDICVEIHINDGGKSGIEGWYKGKEENLSKKLTERIVNAICARTGLTNQGIKSEFDHELKTLAFLHNTNPTSSLIECLYIDNAQDQNFLKDETKLDLLAEGIVDGILDFFDVDRPDTTGQAGNIFQSPQGQQFQPTQQGTTTQSPSLSQDFFKPTQFPQYSAQTTPTPAYGFGTGGDSFGAGAFGSVSLQSREERKKMIQDRYRQILGKDINEQDLNYFLNLGLNEDQMIRRLVDSQEHADMVKSYEEYNKIKPEYDKLKMEVKELETKLKDREEIINKQNELIEQKNKSIQELQKGQAQETPTTPSPLPQIQGQPQGVIEDGNKGRESFFDKVLRKLNDLFD